MLKKKEKKLQPENRGLFFFSQKTSYRFREGKWSGFYVIYIKTKGKNFFFAGRLIPKQKQNAEKAEVCEKILFFFCRKKFLFAFHKT